MKRERKGKEESTPVKEQTNRTPNKTKLTRSGFPLPLFAVKVFLSNYKTNFRSNTHWCKKLAAREPKLLEKFTLKFHL